MNSVFSVPGALVFTAVIIGLTILFGHPTPKAPTAVPTTTVLTCEVSK